MKNAQIWLVILAAVLVAGAVPVNTSSTAALPLDPGPADLIQFDTPAAAVDDPTGSQIITFQPEIEPENIAPSTVAEASPRTVADPGTDSIPVSEPRGLATFGLGLLGVCALRRRRG